MKKFNELKELLDTIEADADKFYNKANSAAGTRLRKGMQDLKNVPGRTASNISPETTCRLANDFKNIIGTKDASGSFDQFNLIMRDKPEEFLLISGDDPVALPMIALGAVGVISVVGNALPKQTSDMIRLALEGNFLEARKKHFDLVEFTRLIFSEGNPAGVKAALKHFKVCEEQVRLPLVKSSPSLYKQIEEQIEKILAV